MCLTYLYKSFTDKDLFATLHLKSQEKIKHCLLLSVQLQKDDFQNSCLPGLIVHIAKQPFYAPVLRKTRPWIDLITFVFDCMVNESVRFKKFGLYVMEKGLMAFIHILSFNRPDRNQMSKLSKVIQNCRVFVGLELHELRFIALQVVISLLNILSFDSDKFLYQNLVLLLAGTLPLVARQTDASATQLLQKISVEIEPKLLTQKEHLEEMMSSVLEIIELDTIQLETKLNATRLAVSLLKGKLQDSSYPLIHVKLTQVILELVSHEVLTDECIWCENTTNNKDEDVDERMTMFGKEVMKNIELTVEDNVLFDYLLPTLESYASNDLYFGRRRGVMILVPFLKVSTFFFLRHKYVLYLTYISLYVTYKE